jgi:hypothetical protein
MFRLWHLVCLVVGVGLIAFGAIALTPKKQQNPRCDIPDSIMYPQGEGTTFTCPDKSQRLTVVREAGYLTYIRCSCK